MLICVLCCFCITAHAQSYNNVNKGDIIDINGVKALVFHVDKNGHGVAIAVKALRGRKNVWCNDKNILKSMIPTIDSDGMKNTEIVYHCIENNNYSISSFPAFEWCKNLGIGWFIPSKEDLEFFLNYYLGHDFEFDWDSEEEFDIDSESISPKSINEKILNAGGIPFLGNAIPGSLCTIGICTSTRTSDNKIFIYQYFPRKNTYCFKKVPVGMLDNFIMVRAFYRF